MPYDIETLVERFHTLFLVTTGGKKVGKSKAVIKTPDIQIQNRKMQINNFTAVCASIHRDPEHLSTFMASELQKETSISANGTLVIHGTYKKSDIEGKIIKYVLEFVQCKMCKQHDTKIEKENRITYINCNKCFSRNAL
ncbi:MAG: translation initiation factor 2 subunit beta [Hyperionvirus sp.]|uniref:Translation initiation factor 2 subunit beta n=1 Tax=Hyperionvirus sp. TaxID=2487770 RepID=A0A3G5AD97_9VIRU|nr:MAG: translation initiation factor 2 subunit beta [Hyperionvirus sp.]